MLCPHYSPRKSNSGLQRAWRKTWKPKTRLGPGCVPGYGLKTDGEHSKHFISYRLVYFVLWHFTFTSLGLRPGGEHRHTFHFIIEKLTTFTTIPLNFFYLPKVNTSQNMLGSFLNQISPVAFGIACLLAGLGSVAVSKAVAAANMKKHAADKDLKSEANDLLIGNALGGAFLLLGALILFGAGVGSASKARVSSWSNKK